MIEGVKPYNAFLVVKQLDDLHHPSTLIVNELDLVEALVSRYGMLEYCAYLSIARAIQFRFIKYHCGGLVLWER